MALSTAQDLIDLALRLLGVVDQEGTATTTQRNQGLDALNALIDSLAIDRLQNYIDTDEAITLTTASTTWGVGGVINTARPLQILAARRVDGSYEYPLEIKTMAEYRDRLDKSVTGLITGLAYDPTMALGTLYAIGGVGSIKVTSLKAWTQYSTLSTALSLPPGYTRALRHTLAIELSPEYSLQPSPVSLSVAQKLRSELGRVNAVVHEVENAYCVGSGYDINSDTVL